MGQVSTADTAGILLAKSEYHHVQLVQIPVLRLHKVLVQTVTAWTSLNTVARAWTRAQRAHSHTDVTRNMAVG